MYVIFYQEEVPVMVKPKVNSSPKKAKKAKVEEESEEDSEGLFILIAKTHLSKNVDVYKSTVGYLSLFSNKSYDVLGYVYIEHNALLMTKIKIKIKCNFL